MLKDRGSLPAGLSSSDLVTVTTAGISSGGSTQQARLGQCIPRTSDEAGQGKGINKELGEKNVACHHWPPMDPRLGQVGIYKS